MDLPDAYITVFIGKKSIDEAPDPYSSGIIFSNRIEQMHMDLFDSLVQSFSAKCNIHLSVESDKHSAKDVVIRLDGTTGDVESDQQLEELLYDSTLRELEALAGAEENSIVAPSLVESTLFLKDQQGELIEAIIKYRKPVDSTYTFFSVTPEGRAYRVAALCSTENQFIETNWSRKKPLTAYSIFDEHKQWYNAQTGGVIKGGLANYLGIDIKKTML